MTTGPGPQHVAPIFSPAFVQDPYPTYRAHLAGPAVQAFELLPGRWGVFHYSACAELGGDARLSARRAAYFRPTGSAEREELEELITHMSRWILLRDPPDHTRLRKGMNAGFSPTLMETLKPRVQSVVTSLLDELPTKEDPDLIRDLAYPLPVRVICELLGVPQELHARCVRLSNDFACWFADPLRTTATGRTAQAAVRELAGIFGTLIRARDTDPAEDLLSVIMAVGRQMTMSLEEMEAQCVLLLIAGHETTRNLIGNGIYTLLGHPDQLEAVRSSEAAARAAVEEILRFESPVQAYGRLVKEDIEYAGVRIPAGDSIFFMIAAAQRDERHIPAPDRFDIARRHNRHLAFGADAHVCLGSTLARLEGQIAIQETARRFPRMARRDAVPTWSPVWAFRGLTQLKVRL